MLNGQKVGSSMSLYSWARTVMVMMIVELKRNHMMFWNHMFAFSCMSVSLVTQRMLFLESAFVSIIRISLWMCATLT